jgi:excisionase family DNA binding protein
VDDVAAGGSASQPFDFSGAESAAGTHGVTSIGPGGTVNGAPAVRDAGSGSLLTVAEVAAHLGVCRAIVYRICRKGQIAHIRVSNAIRIPEGALASYLRPR